VKKKKDDKKRSFVFVWIKAKKNECIRSSTIEDLPLLLGTVSFKPVPRAIEGNFKSLLGNRNFSSGKYSEKFV
jgi:hypothetical protein